MSCLPCLSVTLAYCGQTVGWIKMKLGMQEASALATLHIVLDGDPARSSLYPKGQSPQFSAHICCCQMAAWIKMPLGMETGLGPGHIVLDRDLQLPRAKGVPHSPQFSSHVYCRQMAAWMDQDDTWYGARPRPRLYCVRWNPATLDRKGGTAPNAPNSRPMSIVAKRLDGSRCHLVRRLASAQATLC